MARKRDPRRRAVDRYAGLKEPQAVLDFHERGVLTPQQVKQETEQFVRAAKEQGRTRLRIVTGRGVHSRGQPVVRPQVQRTLRSLEAQGLVRSYGPEKVGAGGDGALCVLL